MKQFFSQLDKAFENRVRLGIMAILVVNEWVEFSRLKELLDLTDGNLASHLSSLEKLNYMTLKKEFVNKKPRTSYMATKAGKKAFKAHIEAIENILKSTK